MMHNLIADIQKGGDFLSKMISLISFFHVRTVKGAN